MRIAYVVVDNLVPDSGVFKKIKGQISYWKNDGHEVKLFVVSMNNKEIEITETGASTELAYISINSIRSTRGIYDITYRLQKFVDCIIGWNPTTVYYRYSFYTPAWHRLLKTVPSFVEINSDDLTEFHLTSKRLYYFNYFTRAKILSNVKGQIFVTNELRKRECFSSFNKSSITIANGINLSNYTVLPIGQTARPRLVFVGSPGWSWHGIDKIIQMAQCMPEFDFDIIGMSNCDFIKPPNNITFYGFLPREGYESILQHATVAIGTLALHRIKMDEASPLKVREYLAFGLPIIIGYMDTDFVTKNKYILQLPNYENNVLDNITSIRSFVLEMKHCRVPRNEISQIDFFDKERLRLSFIQENLI